MKLTREETLWLHRQMWKDMKSALGDNPSYIQRVLFKEEWCKKHFPNEEIFNNCFLCEYAMQKFCEVEDYTPHFDSDFIPACCQYCPIDWRDEVYGSYGYACERGSVTWGNSTISEILALPERIVNENI